MDIEAPKDLTNLDATEDVQKASGENVNAEDFKQRLKFYSITKHDMASSVPKRETFTCLITVIIAN